MELRNHPKMRRCGSPNWPPEWAGTYSNENPLPYGEVGTLKRVEPKSANSLLPTRCHLVMEYRGQEYVTTLYFDDLDFYQGVCKALQAFVGQPISAIGSLDIPETPSLKL